MESRFGFLSSIIQNAQLGLVRSRLIPQSPYSIQRTRNLDSWLVPAPISLPLLPKLPLPWRDAAIPTDSPDYISIRHPANNSEFLILPSFDRPRVPLPGGGIITTLTAGTQNLERGGLPHMPQFLRVDLPTWKTPGVLAERKHEE